MENPLGPSFLGHFVSLLCLCQDLKMANQRWHDTAYQSLADQVSRWAIGGVCIPTFSDQLLQSLAVFWQIIEVGTAVVENGKNDGTIVFFVFERDILGVYLQVSVMSPFINGHREAC
jgi:uncharacterized membrane protein YhaH (DUF805 family)